MIFLGYNFLQDKYCWQPVPTNLVNIEDITIKNGIYDHFNITKDVAKKYKKLLDLQDEQLEEHFLKHRITHGKIYTDDDIFLRLSQIIKG